MAQPLQFDFINEIITVPSPDTTLDLQYLVNQCRDTEDDAEPGMAFGQIISAFGKQDLGGGVLVGITVVLLDNWTVKFQDRSGPSTVSVRISGGNLVGANGHNPISPSTYTQVTLANSSSATIAIPASQTNLSYLVESLRPNHTGLGNVFYWDPYSGDDTKDGTTPTTAVKTFSKAQTLTVAGHYDIIYSLANDPSGITTTTETLNITQNGLKLRGPGYTFQIKPTATTSPTITIASGNVEVEGIYLETAATGSQDGISVTSGNYNIISNCWIANCRGNGISVTSSSFSQIIGCAIEHCGKSGTGNGINVTNSVVQINIAQNIIYDAVNGISLAGTGISDNTITNNLIYQNSSYGTTIGTGVLRTTVRSGNTFNMNTAGDTQNLGTNTFIESQAGGATPSQVAVAVWDELISSHLTTGTTGRTLRDAKTKATLASIKS